MKVWGLVGLRNYFSFIAKRIIIDRTRKEVVSNYFCQYEIFALIWNFNIGKFGIVSS